MTNYTVENIKDIEDQAPNFGLSPELEARFAREQLGLNELGLSYQRLAPNYRMPFGHKQKRQEEVYVLLSGSARLKLDDEVVELKQWDLIRVPKEVTRNFEAGPTASRSSRSERRTQGSRTPSSCPAGGATSE
jgi:hypothetical protein